MTRLKNQSPLTQTADVGGMNGSMGLVKLDGIEGWDPFGWVESC
jgi:hypothetical protein